MFTMESEARLRAPVKKEMDQARPAVVFDLNGCLSDDSHRRHLSPRYGGSSWEDYDDSCADDLPVMPVRWLAIQLAKTCDIVIVTGRSERVRPLTVEWLRTYSIPYARLIMRPVSEQRRNPQMKVHFWRRRFRSQPVLWFEDDPESAEALRAEGCPVIEVGGHHWV